MRGAGIASLAFYYFDFREDQISTYVDYSRRSWSNFVINPTRTVIFYPSCTQNTPKARVFPAEMYLQDA